MKTTGSKFAQSCIVGLILLTPLFAQDSVKTVILSQRVGEQIDRGEREQFGIFQMFNDFESARMFWRPDSTFFALITLKGTDGSMRDTTIEYSENQVFNMAERIRNFERLSAETYKMGSEPIILKTTDGQLIKRSGIQKTEYSLEGYPPTHSDRLPLIPDSVDEGLIFDNMTIGFGLGISRYSPDYSGLVSAFREIEQAFQSQNYPIAPHEPQFSPSTLLWLNFKIRATRSFAVLLEAGTQLGGDANIKAAALSLEYAYRDFRFAGFHPYVAAGVSRYAISVEEKYDAAIGTYTVLDGVTFDAKSLGIHATLGVETEGRNTFDVYLGYAYIPDVTKGTDQGVDARIHLSSLLLGCRFSIFF